MHIGEELLRFRILRRGGGRRRIDDRRIGVGREHARDLHAFIRGGVGLIDDAERRFLARDEDQRAAAVGGVCVFLLDRIPYVELWQRGLAVFAGRDGIGIGHGELAVA